jgi:hypothetical protein
MNRRGIIKKLVWGLLRYFPSITLVIVILLKGPYQSLVVFGYGMGIVFLLLYLTCFSKEKIRILTLSLTYLCLIFVLLSWEISVSELHREPDFEKKWNLILSLFRFSLLVTLQSFILGFIAFLSLRELPIPPAQSIKKILITYLLGIVFPVIYPWVITGISVLYVLEGGLIYVGIWKIIPPIYFMVLLYLTSWTIIYFLQRKHANEKLVSFIKSRNFGQYNARKLIFFGFILFLVACTLFESLRGLWWVWFGTAIWLILMFASLWKIWRHVFDVPRAEEAKDGL